MTPEPGQLVGGRYRLERPLSAGGMGLVWVARHVELDVEVALKFILSEQTEGVEAARARFKREAQAAAQLKTPHVTQVHDFGLEGSMPYIAMELLVGEDLATRLERIGRLELGDCVTIIDQLCRGLGIAHDAGIVHRDLKPANIFLAQMGDQEMVKILDFGIAKLLGVRMPAGSKTATGAIIGTPRYMSPEQALGIGVGPSTDLWSVAIVLFEMLTGAFPFEHEIVFDVAGAVGGGPNPTATERVPTLPSTVDAFFERALALDPNQRFHSARELSEALKAVAAGGPLPTDTDAPATRPAAAPRAGALAPSGAAQGGHANRTRPSADLEQAATISASDLPTEQPVVGVESARLAAARRPALAWGLGAGVILILFAAITVWLVARAPSGEAGEREAAEAPTASSGPVDAHGTVERGSQQTDLSARGTEPRDGTTAPPSSPPGGAAAASSDGTTRAADTTPTSSLVSTATRPVPSRPPSGPDVHMASPAPTATRTPPAATATPTAPTSTRSAVDGTFGI